VFTIHRHAVSFFFQDFHPKDKKIFVPCVTVPSEESQSKALSFFTRYRYATLSEADREESFKNFSNNAKST
jgi:hypothetical protein